MQNLGYNQSVLWGIRKSRIFLHHILEMKPKYRSVYHALDLSLDQPKGGRGRLIEGYFPIILYNHFGTLITGHLIEGGP